MFNPKDQTVQQNLPKIKEKLLDRKIKIYIIASDYLKKLILAGVHPNVKGIPKMFIEVLIKGEGLLIQKQMLFDWLSGTLDKKNSWILENCEILVVNNEKQRKAEDIL